MNMPSGDKSRVAIVGGGLAGLAAAVALVRAGGVQIQLFEARRRLGGRATSFRDAEDAAWIDHCQHVSMRCCTNLSHFCQQTGLADAFERHRTLHFFDPIGRHYRFRGSRYLPAPLHLATALWALKFLSARERIAIARALWKLARLRDPAELQNQTVGHWLREQRQSSHAIETFWELILQSALGESVEHAALGYARKVFVEGFMAHRQAYEVEIPNISLGELYGQRLHQWLTRHGVTLTRGIRVQMIEVEYGRAHRLRHVPLAESADTETVNDPFEAGQPVSGTTPCDAVIAAVPWRHVASLFDEATLANLPVLPRAAQIESAPISAVHLWFDRPITHLPHAVLVGRLSQWVFRRSPPTTDSEPGYAGDIDSRSHYYQVVISASRQLVGRPRDEVIAQVLGDLQSAWPAASEAKLLRAKVVTDPHAVFSVRPGIDPLRPSQQTSISNLVLAGDWTATTWPATMEGAVRSGYLAAEAVLRHLGRAAPCVQPDLPRGWLTRWLWK